MVEVLVQFALALLHVHVTVRRSRHRAVGVAQRSWFYAGHHSRGVAGSIGTARSIIERLHEERRVAALVAA